MKQKDPLLQGPIGFCLAHKYIGKPSELFEASMGDTSVCIGQYKTRTADCGLRTGYKIRTRKYGLGIKHGQGIKRRLWTADCGLGIKYGLWTTLVKTVQTGSR